MYREKHEDHRREGTDLNSESAVGVFGEVRAACMAGRNVFDAIRATDRVEGALRTTAAGIALG